MKFCHLHSSCLARCALRTSWIRSQCSLVVGLVLHLVEHMISRAKVKLKKGFILFARDQKRTK